MILVSVQSPVRGRRSTSRRMMPSKKKAFVDKLQVVPKELSLEPLHTTWTVKFCGRFTVFCILTVISVRLWNFKDGGS